jgi:NADH/NAD ratio-sensing transcriptional regulator Rex
VRDRIPEATVARLPVYLRCLVDMSERGTHRVSSDQLADAAGVNSAKVRKDLSYLGSYGTRGVGYDVEYLIYQVRRELGLEQDWAVAIVVSATSATPWPTTGASPSAASGSPPSWTATPARSARCWAI